MVRFLNVYFPTKGIFLFLSEAVIVAGSFLLSIFLTQGADAMVILDADHGWIKIAVITALILTLSYYLNLYEPTILFDPREIYFRILVLAGFVCLILAAALHFYPGLWLGKNIYTISFIVMTIALVGWRKVYARITGTRAFRERVYILGNGDFAEAIADKIRQRPDLGMEVVGVHFSRADGSIAPDATAAVQSLLTSKPRVHRVVMAIQDRRGGGLPTADLLSLRFKGVVLEEHTSLLERLYGKIQLDGLRPSSFLYVEGFRIRPSQQFTRRIASTIAAAIGLISFLPFLPFVMLLVRLTSPGPVFFRQTRVGLNGKLFNVYKFRTMRQDAEAAGAKWASKNDPRVTSVGAFMRKTRIDEIPQLWNVLRGDMSFVGPRPERPEFIPMLEAALPFYDLRQTIRPGLTGWAQVRYGYGATLEESREKLEYDLYYLKHGSLGLDLLIMFETIKIILHRRGAQ